MVSTNGATGSACPLLLCPPDCKDTNSVRVSIHDSPGIADLYPHQMCCTCNPRDKSARANQSSNAQGELHLPVLHLQSNKTQ